MTKRAAMQRPWMKKDKNKGNVESKQLPFMGDVQDLKSEMWMHGRWGEFGQVQRCWTRMIYVHDSAENVETRTASTA